MAHFEDAIKLSGVVQGFDAFVLADLARKNKAHLHIATDEVKAAKIKDALSVTF